MESNLSKRFDFNELFLNQLMISLVTTVFSGFKCSLMLTIGIFFFLALMEIWTTDSFVSDSVIPWCRNT